ncbi:MAG: hypothetical protein IPK54_10210 [Dokdonella sp.]|uniref:hypothetical protein n=1 Tax=Dokdonella sp. TaxID=2291710 RepID=UPI0025BD4057|nr:hypothetical protein [Dokdonella sp.]MBK8123905.1 hypothetical protein [Dokdonella sp.]
MALTFPRTPGLFVRAICDTAVYHEGDIALIANTPQPRIADYVNLVWPNSHPYYRAHSLNIMNFFDGRNFEALAYTVKNINHIHLFELVAYANKQSPAIAILFAEDVQNPHLRDTPNVHSSPPAVPPSFYFYRVDIPRTLTNDYLKKEKDEN